MISEYSVTGYTIFKETEMGRWVHLVCALYIPGVAFSEVSTYYIVLEHKKSFECNMLIGLFPLPYYQLHKYKVIH